MKRYRLIEYEIPDDYTQSQIDWLERTFEVSINGCYSWVTGTSITAAEVDLEDWPTGRTIQDWEVMERARSTPWRPDRPVHREFYKTGVCLREHKD